MEDDRAAIQHLVDAWMAATQAGDLNGILDLMTEDVVFMVPGRDPFGREDFVAMSRGTTALRLQGTNEIVELQVLGDWAFARSHIDMTVTSASGDVLRRTGYTLSIFRKGADARWRLARDANLMAVRS